MQSISHYLLLTKRHLYTSHETLYYFIDTLSVYCIFKDYFENSLGVIMRPKKVSNLTKFKRKAVTTTIEWKK